MGNWHISIEGVGSHHNKDNPPDADRMAAEFVEALKSKGHQISRASFTFGSSQRLADVNASDMAIDLTKVERYDHGVSVQTTHGKLFLNYEALAELAKRSAT